MTAQLTDDEQALALQTIEMFDVVTQSNPLDYESLEILKEAYFKLSRQQEAIETSKKIADAYVHSGKLSSAILEYESILQAVPDDPDVQKALDSIEERAAQLAEPRESSSTELRAISDPQSHEEPDTSSETSIFDLEDGRASMFKMLVEGKQMAEADFNLYWNSPDPKQVFAEPTEPFLQTLVDKQVLSIEKAISLVAGKSRLCYLPLEKYDVDVELTRGFPREICLRWCILPFDRMSKSILVATANPFNQRAARELDNFNRQTSMAHRFIWYLAAPVELVKMLRKAFR